MSYFRIALRADVGGWDVDEIEADSHRELFRLYAEQLRADAARHQSQADRMRALADYADRLAQVDEPEDKAALS